MFSDVRQALGTLGAALDGVEQASTPEPRRRNPAVTEAEIMAAIDEWASDGDRHLDADGYLREIPVPDHW